MPVKAGLLRRAAIRKALCKQLHPNPDDEFCSPDIGPNEEIIAKYRHLLSQMDGLTIIHAFGSPITVEKIRPDGYLILNGHHRWAAALQRGVRKVPIEIVDLTQEADLRSMFRKAKHEKRVAFDLDEVVFCHDEENGAMEKRLPFPFNKIYKERLYLGIPALFHFLRKNGYDIWVFSSNYYSSDYIRNLFRHYFVYLTGIVTGTQRKTAYDPKKRVSLAKEFQNLYTVSIHADKKSLVYVDNRTKEFREFELNQDSNWSAAIMDIIREISSNEK